MAHGEPGQSYAFSKIDPKVAAIAGDSRDFTYLSANFAAS